LDNGLKILDLLSVRDNIGVTEISQLSKLGKSSTYNILATLVWRGYVEKTPQSKYRLGPKLAALGGLVTERQHLGEVATPYIRDLRDKLHETVAINVLNTNGRAIIVQREEGDSPEHVRDRVGYEVDAHTTAIGKVLLAYLPETMRDEILSRLKYKVYTNKTIATPAKLLEVLQAVRSQGYAVDQDERYIGFGCIAAPIFDNSGLCVAALSVVCAETVFNSEKDHFLEELLVCAARISHQMGFTNELAIS
jgi:DNA-binding IclR family transcriptional regulator